MINSYNNINGNHFHTGGGIMVRELGLQPKRSSSKSNWWSQEEHLATITLESHKNPIAYNATP